jgi:hypothetical protein
MVLEASSRPDLFAQLKERGINAISVTEGVVKGGGKKPVGGTPVSRSAVLIAVLILGIAGAFFYFSFSNDRGADAGRAVGGSGETVKKPKKIEKPLVKPVSAATTNHSSVALNKVDELPPSKRILQESYTIVTNGRGKIIERYRTADGKSHMVVSQVQPVFKEPSDQLLAMALAGSTDGTGAPPPVPGGVSEAQFRKSLETPIVINATDSDAIKEIKQRVIDARAAALEMLNEGQSLDSILSEHHKLAMENEAIRSECQRVLKEFVDKGDAEGAREYCEKASAALKEMGIAELRMPMTDEEREELYERRRLAREEAAARRAAAKEAQRKK